VQAFDGLKETYVPRKFSENITTVPEILILDAQNKPEVNVDVVSEGGILFGNKLKYAIPLCPLISSIPKAARVTAYATFALSVGYVDTTLPPPDVAAGPVELSPFQGTAVAIDDHHLLTSAHLLQFDVIERPYPTANLKHLYCSFLGLCLIGSIHVRHNHSNHVDRMRMHSHPSAEDFDVDVAAYVDGADPTVVRVVSATLLPIEVDCALLYSKRSLGLKSYPVPSRSHHSPPPAIFSPEDVSLLAYNGLPSATFLAKTYPNTPTPILHSAIRDLWIDRLSYATGKTAKGTDPATILHRISSYSGASGGAVLNARGQWIGNNIIHLLLTS
jgi:hypothetical protein